MSCGSSAKLQSFAVVLPKLEQWECHLRTLQAWTCALCGSTRRSHRLHPSEWRAVWSPSYRPWRRHGTFASFPDSESTCSSPAQLAELGQLEFYVLSALEFTGVPPGSAPQSPSLRTNTCSATAVNYCQSRQFTVLVRLRDCVPTAGVDDQVDCVEMMYWSVRTPSLWWRQPLRSMQKLSRIKLWLKTTVQTVRMRLSLSQTSNVHLVKEAVGTSVEQE